MIRYSCHSENFGILSAEHTFSLIHDLQFDCIDIASRSLIPQNQIQSYLVSLQKNPHLGLFLTMRRRNIKCLSGLFSDRSMQDLA